MSNVRSQEERKAQEVVFGWLEEKQRGRGPLGGYLNIHICASSGGAGIDQEGDVLVKYVREATNVLAETLAKDPKDALQNALETLNQFDVEFNRNLSRKT